MYNAAANANRWAAVAQQKGAMNNHKIAFQFWLDLKRKHKIYVALDHESIIADIEELLNKQAAQPSVQADGVYCSCNPNEAPYKIGSNVCAVCERPRC